jgi:hypothetical protein
MRWRIGDLRFDAYEHILNQHTFAVAARLMGRG